MLGKFKKVFFVLGMLIVFFNTSVFCTENQYPYDEIKKSFDLKKYQEVDLLDYMRIESGMAYLYEKKHDADIYYVKLFLFSSMGKIIYNLYFTENDVCFLLKEEYKYTAPYETENQTIITSFYTVSNDAILYVKSNGEKEIATDADTKVLDRIVSTAKEIIKDFE